VPLLPPAPVPNTHADAGVDAVTGSCVGGGAGRGVRAIARIESGKGRLEAAEEEEEEEADEEEEEEAEAEDGAETVGVINAGAHSALPADREEGREEEMPGTGSELDCPVAAVRTRVAVLGADLAEEEEKEEEEEEEEEKEAEEEADMVEEEAHRAV
jgi:hypothetical protein